MTRKSVSSRLATTGTGRLRGRGLSNGAPREPRRRVSVVSSAATAVRGVTATQITTGCRVAEVFIKV